MPHTDDIEREGSPGWRRSDERICRDVTLALADDPGLDAGDVEVRVAEGRVTLTGTVADKLARRRAEEIAERVFGVTDVQNLLRVRRDGRDMEASSGRRGDREVTRRTERDDLDVSVPPPPRRREGPPSSPETRVD